MNDSQPLRIDDNAHLPSVDVAPVSNCAETQTEVTMQCPACRAKQVWSPECRRCAANLTLLRQFEEMFLQQRTRLLAALRDGRNRTAIRHAFRLYQLRPNAESVRLLAVSQLLSGNFAQATQIGSMLDAGRPDALTR